MESRSDRLKRCPICRYRLRGLPANHRCPECGFEYDETMQIWWTTAIPPWLLFAAWFVSVILLGDWLAGSRTVSAGLTRGEVWLVLASVSGAVAFLCLFYPKGFVAVRRSGLVYRFPFRSVRSVPWETLEFARNLTMSRRNEDGTRRPLLLPTLGLRWLRRRHIHAEIARRWAEARA